jgi:hypothetical protein
LYDKDATLKIYQARTAIKIRFGGHFVVTRLMLGSNLKFKICWKIACERNKFNGV